jgi:hypothetical protein
MLGVDTDHAHHALAMDNLALITHLLYRSTHLHQFILETASSKLHSIKSAIYSADEIVLRKFHLFGSLPSLGSLSTNLAAPTNWK